MYLPLGVLWVASFFHAEAKIGFPVPPSYGDVMIWPGNGTVMVSLAPDGWDINDSYLYHVCSDTNGIDRISQVVTHQLGFQKCPLYLKSNNSTRGGISCSNCDGSENHVLRCCNSSIVMCSSVLYLSDGCHGPKRPLINRDSNDYSGNKGYSGEVLLFPPVSNISMKTPASVSMGLVAIKKECHDCSQWKFIRKNTHTVDMSLVTTLCRQMGFTHVNPGFVLTHSVVKDLYNYNFSYWSPAMLDYHFTSEIGCSRSQRCLGCCQYEASCDNQEGIWRKDSIESYDDYLVIRCSFYPDQSIPPSGDEKSCKFVNCKQDSSSCYLFTNLDDVKLQGNSTQTSSLEGRLEYFKDSQWHTVCSSEFQKEEADLVCQKLGHSSAKEFGNASSYGFEAGSSGVPLQLSCKNNYSSSCTVQVSTCTHDEDVGLVCTNHSNNDTIYLYISSGVLVIISLILLIVIVFLIIKCVLNNRRRRRAGYENLDNQEPNPRN